MKNRLEIAKSLLSEDGSIYVNLDFNQVHYGKILLDEIFGEENFQREIIWRIGWLSGYKTAANNFIRNHDTILYYSKNSEQVFFNKTYIPKEEFAPRFPGNTVKDLTNELVSLGLKKGSAKDFMEKAGSIGLPDRYPLEDTWNCSIYDKLNSIAVVSFAGEKVSKLLDVEEIKGQKSEALVERIIRSSTKKNDIVLDFFGGSGTTGAVAHKLNRQYLVLEQMDYFDGTLVNRLKKVVDGDGVGISSANKWTGGGKFNSFELKKYNQTFIDEIEVAKDSEALLKIWDAMKSKSFLSYNVDLKKQDEHIEEFKSLALEEQKQHLVSLLDKNQLYVNLSSLDDKDFACTDVEKKVTRDFYRLNT